MRNLIFLVFLFSCISAAQDKIILTNTSIGNMPIEVGIEISLYKIKTHFPFYKVTQQIASGDSPDYHLYIVSTYENEELISFISYINESDGYEKSVVKLDEVIIHSSKVQDHFGVKPSMTISQAIEKRKYLKFGAGHMDNYLGNDKIWYMFSVNQTHGTQVTKETAIKANPKIQSISWPIPWWS
jgi:hypothetical protein